MIFTTAKGLLLRQTSGGGFLSGIAAARQPHGERSSDRAATPSRIAARCHALWLSPASPVAGAVSVRKRSIAAEIAAASCSDGAGTIAPILGRRGRRSPFLLMCASNHRGRNNERSEVVRTEFQTDFIP